MSKTITLEEVSKHGDRDSTYMVIDAKVYDVTKFVEEHPGGEEVMLDHAGRDATQGFEDVGHSIDARDMLKEYLVGELPEEEKGKAAAAANVAANAPASEGGSSTMILAVVAVAVAVAAYKFAM